MDIYLIRHGRIHVTNGDFFGAKLSDVGRLEIKQFIVSETIPQPDKIIASDYLRARETADEFSRHFKIPYRVDSDLGEWKLQSLNLPSDRYFIEERRGWSEQQVAVCGGESLQDAKCRLWRGIRRAVEEHSQSERIWIVSHGTVIDTVCADLASRPATIEDIHKIGFLHYAVIRHTNGQFELIRDILRNS